MNNNLRGVSGLSHTYDPYNLRPTSPPDATPTWPNPHVH